MTVVFVVLLVDIIDEKEAVNGTLFEGGSTSHSTGAANPSLTLTRYGYTPSGASGDGRRYYYDEHSHHSWAKRAFSSQKFSPSFNVSSATFAFKLWLIWYQFVATFNVNSFFLFFANEMPFRSERSIFNVKNEIKLLILFAIVPLVFQSFPLFLNLKIRFISGICKTIFVLTFSVIVCFLNSMWLQNDVSLASLCHILFFFSCCLLYKKTFTLKNREFFILFLNFAKSATQW